jgi:hypothetical protein
LEIEKELFGDDHINYIFTLKKLSYFLKGQKDFLGEKMHLLKILEIL